MAKKKRLPKDWERVVQGEWTLGHSIHELRDNVCVGETPLKDVPEEQLSIIWNEKIGTKYFREAVRREVVHRVSSYFKTGYEKAAAGFSPSKLATELPKRAPTNNPEMDALMESLRRESIQS